MSSGLKHAKEGTAEEQMVGLTETNAIARYIGKLSEIAGSAAGWGMLFVSAVMTYEIIMRYLGAPTTWVVEISGYAMVWCTFLSAAYVLRLDGHIRVDILLYRLTQTTRNAFDVINYAFILGYTLLVLYSSGVGLFDAIAMNERSASLLRLHLGWLYGVMVIGCILVALQALPLLVTAVKAMVSQTRAGKANYSHLAPSLVYLLLIGVSGWLYFRYPIAGLVALMLILLFGGVSIFAALGLVGCLGLYILLGTEVGLSQISPISIKALNQFTLLAVPLYILGGQILVSSGVGKELFEVCSKWIGHWPGGRMVATIAACAIFAAISGSSVATAATIGIIAIPEMIKTNYRPSDAYGAVAAGGTLGILIPPSGTMIIYSMLTDESTGALFIGGVVPGIIMACLFGIFAFMLCVKTGCYEKVSKASWPERLASVRTAVWAFLAPCIVIVGIYSGLLTPTEAAAVVAVYALIVGLIRRKIRIGDLNTVLCSGTKSATMLLMIVVGAIILGSVGTYLQIPGMVSEYIGALPYPPWVIMFILVIFYIILGCLLEVVSILMITIPIVYPIIVKLGYNGVWFGVFIVLLMELALITPPVGMNLFVIQGIADTEVAPVIKGAFPYMIILLVGLFILYVWPQLILWLPSTMGYAGAR